MKAYSDPYFAGIALGGVLLGAFVLAGRGLGASGAFAAAASGTVAALAPSYARTHAYFGSYVSQPGGPWHDWLLAEIAGVLVGGFLSAAAAGRLRREIERGPRISPRARVAAAAGGGAIMGAGAALARGCTSGQALTGGALLSVGGWAFMLAAFAAAYGVAPALKRAWR